MPPHPCYQTHYGPSAARSHDPPVSASHESWTQFPCFPDGQWSHGLLIAVLLTICVLRRQNVGQLPG